MAEASGVSIPTVKRLESSDGPIGGRPETIQKLISALEAAGVEFTNGGQPGVRLRKGSNTAADLTDRIDTIEADLAKSKGDSPRTPAGGMQTLERAHKREAVTKLKNKRTKLKK